MLKIKKYRGFTLVEIMIVVAIIGLLAAIAMPNLLRSRLNANEGAAIANLRVIANACISFYNSQTPPAYPVNIVALSGTMPPYLNAALTNASAAASARQGYFYTYVRASAYQFTCTAAPAVSNVTGERVFFVDETGVIRIDDAAGPAVQ